LEIDRSSAPAKLYTIAPWRRTLLKNCSWNICGWSWQPGSRREECWAGTQASSRRSAELYSYHVRRNATRFVLPGPSCVFFPASWTDSGSCPLYGCCRACDMRKGLLSIAILVVLFMCAESFAHSWYPTECCDKRDCGVADFAFMSKSGRLIVVDNGRNIIIPGSLPLGTSRDQYIHICYNRIDVDVFGIPPAVYCVFVPPHV
jgi:hypothetical protein